MTVFERLLEVLSQAGIEFIVIGGFAATAHGSAHLTVDLDVVYRRTPVNIDRLASALKPLQPYLRGAPPGLPFRFDGETIRQGLNFTVRDVGGLDCRFVNLQTLIRLKRAAGRPKDLERIAQLEALQHEAK